MDDERDDANPGHDETPPSLEDIGRLDDLLARLGEERRPSSRQLSAEELREHLLAAQLRLTRDGAEAPTAAFLQSLQRKVGHAVEREARRRRPTVGVSRGRFLRAAATLAGGAGLGVAAVEAPALVRDLEQPHELVVAGNERWYDIAADGEVSPGGVKPFSAGGVLGFLLNDDGQLHAVSAICTHMGCRLKPTSPGPDTNRTSPDLRCLCHGSRFNHRGETIAGLAPSPLPSITVRVAQGRIYALGTRETA
jgi:Rieske Fe-S protein